MSRVALVTGGARGIGFGIAFELAKEGFALVICGTRSPDEVATALDRLRELNGEVVYCRADISCGADRASLLSLAREKFNALHVLINNAGVAPAHRADILVATEESYERVMRVNLQGPYFLAQAAANWMVEQRAADPGYTGCIINIGSVSAEMASLNRGEYCVSKAGMSMMTRLFAARLGGEGISVFEVRPGIVASDMTAQVKEKYDKRIADSELLIQKRWGEPHDVGRAVAVLARGELPYSTGQVLYVDGGLSVPRL